MALKKFVHRIPIYSVTVTGSTVTESWDDRGKKRRRNLYSFISKTAGLPDRTARAQHTLHFALQIFGNIFCPSAFKELCESYPKMHVGVPKNKHFTRVQESCVHITPKMPKYSEIF